MLFKKIYNRMIIEPNERRTNSKIALEWQQKLFNYTPNNTKRNEAKEAAINWLLLAQSNNTHLGEGFDRAYNLKSQNWDRPYPETTGYIISSLIDSAKEFPHLQLWNSATKAIRWLQNIQFESGAICSKQWFSGNKTPSIFNTGMVLHGFVSYLEQKEDVEIELSAHRAATWIIEHQEGDGAWRKFAFQGEAHSYYTMVAWALARYGKLFSNQEAMDSAIRHLNWTLSLREANGWIDRMNFDSSRVATTHTIAYCAQGLAECGVILKDSRFLEAAISLVSPMNSWFLENNFLPGAFDSDWRPIPIYYKNYANRIVECGPWECLTGTAQTSCVNLFLSDTNEVLKTIGQQMNQHLIQRQIQYSDPAVHGALSGSWPIDGPYDTLCLPNHAAKFFIDALNLQDAKG